MSEWWLLSGFVLLLMLALIAALYPVRMFRKSVMLLAPFLIIMVSLAYWQWGAWREWTHSLQEGLKQQRVQSMLKSIREPADLIIKLKATLHNDPTSSRGWYLLGRIYASQNQWQEANDAFALAHKLKPEDELITVNYAQSAWQLNNQQFDDNTRALLTKVLEQNPNQPDALAMFAMDAFGRHDYQKAIDYWQDLLKLAPPQSEEAEAIRKAIAKAQAALLEQNSKN